MSSSEEVITVLEEIYAALKKVKREIRGTDRIREDLGIDSLGAIDLLVALEERFDVRLVDNTKVAGVRTAGELVDLIAETTATKA
ncbi:MAG: acyl carrier protein [Pseudonocardiaceae bacterium]